MGTQSRTTTDGRGRSVHSWVFVPCHPITFISLALLFVVMKMTKRNFSINFSLSYWFWWHCPSALPLSKIPPWPCGQHEEAEEGQERTMICYLSGHLNQFIHSTKMNRCSGGVDAFRALALLWAAENERGQRRQWHDTEDERTERYLPSFKWWAQKQYNNNKLTEKGPEERNDGVSLRCTFLLLISFNAPD